jgi:hypothetical protein
MIEARNFIDELGRRVFDYVSFAVQEGRHLVDTSTSRGLKTLSEMRQWLIRSGLTRRRLGDQLFPQVQRA